jgi:hypothetical protein
MAFRYRGRGSEVEGEVEELGGEMREFSSLGAGTPVHAASEVHLDDSAVGRGLDARGFAQIQALRRASKPSHLTEYFVQRDGCVGRTKKEHRESGHIVRHAHIVCICSFFRTLWCHTRLDMRCRVG